MMVDWTDSPLFTEPPETKPKELLEGDIEDPVCKYARSLGIKAEKFTSPARRSVPDRMFSLPGGFVFFIEFKAPGKPATPKQEEDHEERRAMGFYVFVVDDVEEGKRIVGTMYELFSVRRKEKRHA